MARKNDSSQKAGMREMMRGYLKDNDIRIKDGADVNAIIGSVLVNMEKEQSQPEGT